MIIFLGFWMILHIVIIYYDILSPEPKPIDFSSKFNKIFLPAT